MDVNKEPTVGEKIEKEVTIPLPREVLEQLESALGDSNELYAYATKRVLARYTFVEKTDLDEE